MIDNEKFIEQFHYFDRETTIEIINIFLNENQDRFNELRKNLQEKDYVQLARNSHSLKGTIGSFMAPVPFRLVRDLEEKAIAREDMAIEQCIQDLETACSILAIELTNIRADLLSQM